MNRIQATQILVLVTCSMFLVTYIVPSGTFLIALPSAEWKEYPLHNSPFAGSSTPQGYSPAQIRTAYNLPTSGGNGTTIAIIDAFDTPNILTYFNTFSNQYGLPDNSSGNFIVYKMPGTNVPPPTEIGWQLETCLDVEWAHAIAPNATILLVEAVSDTSNNLLAAVDYATHYSGVVAVSMSWGNLELANEVSYDNHFTKLGITFFASSGDDGSNVLWPAASANVVSVGGTTLNLKPDGTVISETAWRNSSGGVSSYEAAPSFQTNFGLNYSNRAVPDVSYNGDASTGVAVYNGTWWMMGGTSAGAPQWAAIHALGLSASNINLYNRAKSAYSSYFRDIISGSSNNYSAGSGYDLVTGLGSPLTINFGTSLEVSPTSGPANTLITLNGLGFTSGDSVNISYLKPLTSAWTTVVTNLTIDSSNFSYIFAAPDLGKNNTPGDNQAQSDNIIFRVQDRNSNKSYNSTVPFMEMRRGLNQISNETATGIFGNNTNLATSVFLQNSQSITVSGNWFSPGTATLLWDSNISLGTAVIDQTGFFNTIVQVPTTAAGQHILTINDGTSNFCVNLTRLPSVANDYSAGWHTSNITINLTPDYPVNETFYSINSGPVFNVTANGQPAITTEGNSNTLEYWSFWNVYGTGLSELPHVTLTGIQLDKTAPTGTITTAAITSSPIVTLTLSTTQDISGIFQMRFSNDNIAWSNWEPYTPSTTWTLQSEVGQKTVYVQFMDNANLTSPTYSSTLTLQTPQPTATPTPTPSPLITPSPTALPTPTVAPTSSPDVSVPEIPAITAILFLLATSILAVVLIKRRK